MNTVLIFAAWVAAILVIFALLMEAAPKGIERNIETQEWKRQMRELSKGNPINPAVTGVDE